MSRIAQRDYQSEVIAMTMMLYSIPRLEQKVEALAVMPGMGETWRISHAIEVVDSDWSLAKYLLLSGDNRNEKTWEQLTPERLREPPYYLFNSRDCKIVIRDHAEHTKDQADWIVRQVRDLKISSVAIFISPYHLLRAYCTVLKSLLQSDIDKVPIIPVPVPISPETPIPEIGAKAWEMVPAEITRLATYQQKGDVATYDELRGYISWLWKTDLLRAR